MTSFDAAWASVSEVDGWMTEGQARALYDAARACTPGGTIVEIGSFHGRSTIVLASACPPDAMVIAIDPHAGNDRGPQEIDGFEAEADDDHQHFNRNLARAGVADRVTHLRQFSDDALAEIDGEIDVLYVDGAHRYGPARADIATYGARVSDGGTMLIHDSFSSIGVTLAILRELVASRRWTYVSRSRSLTTYRATGHVKRPVNAAQQLAQLPWFAKNVGLKVVLTLGLGKLLRRLGRAAPDWPY
ncbi:MAG: class I SAM-dependent methyltransferase [Ilumatobacteraceae bacterium]|nr:class I SAM-dependent methyltransferase [Ilumatobacteraceae bacterium]